MWMWDFTELRSLGQSLGPASSAGGRVHCIEDTGQRWGARWMARTVTYCRC